MRKSVYAVIIHYFQIIDGKQKVREHCEFLENIKNSKLTQASAIIDIKNMKIIKSRTPDTTVSQYIDYIRNSYPSEWAQLLKVANLEKQFGVGITPEVTEVTEVTEEAIVEVTSIENEKEIS